jgi:hypothetical protein
MWPLPPLDKDLITISFSPDNLVLSWLQKSTNGKAPLQCNAYERHELPHLELEKLILFNPTRMAKLITHFLSRHKKRNAFIAFSLQGTSLIEHFITLPTSHPKATDFGITQSSNALWGYRFMYHNHDGQAVFYVYKIPRLLLLQYKLLAITTKTNLIMVTTHTMSYFNAYKAIFGSSFRQSQFGLDMIRHNNNIEDLISSDILKRMITPPLNISLSDERTYLANAYGIFTTQGLHL